MKAKSREKGFAMELSFVEIAILLDHYYAELGFCDAREEEIKKDSYPQEIKEVEEEKVKIYRENCEKRINEIELYKAKRIVID